MLDVISVPLYASERVAAQSGEFEDHKVSFGGLTLVDIRFFADSYFS